MITSFILKLAAIRSLLAGSGSQTIFCGTKFNAQEVHSFKLCKAQLGGIVQIRKKGQLRIQQRSSSIYSGPSQMILYREQCKPLHLQLYYSIRHVPLFTSVICPNTSRMKNQLKQTKGAYRQPLQQHRLHYLQISHHPQHHPQHPKVLLVLMMQ
jgi:hypothetical protein